MSEMNRDSRWERLAIRISIVGASVTGLGKMSKLLSMVVPGLDVCAIQGRNRYNAASVYHGNRSHIF